MGSIKTVRYVDAQRDCAVEIGERDIRREIIKHRGRLVRWWNVKIISDLYCEG